MLMNQLGIRQIPLHSHHRGGMLAQRPPRSLGQSVWNAKFMDLKNPDVVRFLVSQGLVLAYTATGALLFGKTKALDKIIVGLGIPAFGWAAYSGFKLLDNRSSFHPFNAAVGVLFGAVDALAAVGAGFALAQPKLRSKTAIEAVAKAIPL